MGIKKIIKELLKKKNAENEVMPEDIDFYANGNLKLRDEIVSKLAESNVFEYEVVDDMEIGDDSVDIEDIPADEDEINLDVEPDDLSLSSLESESIEEVIVPFESIENGVRVDDPVRMYLKDIGQIPLLNLEDEKKYANQVLHSRYAIMQLEDHKNGELTLSARELKELNYTIEIAAIAKTKLIESNYRLVVSIAKHYSNNNSNMQLLDLIQEGNMGLMRAVDKFDPQKGFKFSTYATWWIRQAITRANADQARTIRIPVHMVETINKMVRVQRQLLQELEREPTVDELAEKMGITAEKIQNIQRISKEPISLEAPVGEEEDSSLGDFISDPNALNPHEYTLQERTKEALDELLLKTLTPREEKVLKLRYGLIDGRSHTLEEVGRVFGVTRERIRQIEGKALRKLRHPIKQSKLREFYNDNKK